MMKINKGDLIISSKPFAYVLNSGLHEVRCAFCLIRGRGLKKCSGCGFAYFCDRPCQKSAWVDHKLECASLKRVSPRIPPPHVLLIARIIRKLRRGGDEISEKIGNISRKFKDLISHTEEIKSDLHRREGFAAAHFVLTEFLDKEELLPAKDVLEIFGKVLINSVCIMDQCNSIAAGLYLGPSAFNHSCAPNISFVFSGATLLARSLQDFNEFDISKMFVNYIDLAAVTETRQKQLREQYYFTCDCPKCSDETSDNLMVAIRCENEDCFQPIIPTDVICSGCESAVSLDRRNQAVEMFQQLQMETERVVSLIETDILSPDKVVSALEKPIEQSQLVLHPLNIAVMKATHALFEANDIQRNSQSAFKHGSDVLKSLRTYYPEHDYLMWHLERLGRIQMDLGLFKAAANSFSEVWNLVGTSCKWFPGILLFCVGLQRDYVPLRQTVPSFTPNNSSFGRVSTKPGKLNFLTNLFTSSSPAFPQNQY